MTDTPNNEGPFTADEFRADPRVAQQVRDEAIYLTLTSLNADRCVEVSNTVLNALSEAYRQESDTTNYADMVVALVDSTSRFIVGMAFAAKAMQDALPDAPRMDDPELESLLFKAADIDMLPELFRASIESYYQLMKNSEHAANVVAAVDSILRQQAKES